MSAGLESIVATATDRPSGFAPRSQRGLDPAGGPRRIRVGIIGATGYVGAELIRLLARHPNVDLVGLQGRDRDHDPIAAIHPHLGPTGLTVHRELPPVDAVFLALPHGTAADLAPGCSRPGRRSSTRARTSDCATPPTTRAGTASSTRIPSCSTRPSTDCRSSIGPRCRPSSTRRSRSSGRLAATRPRRSSPSPRSPVPA